MKTKALIVLLALIAALLAGMHLRVPYSTWTWSVETPAASARSGGKMTADLPAGDVDVNRGTVENLCELYGVGPTLAQEIIAEREANGAFHYPEDLLNVKGIGEKMLEKMREQLKLP